MNASLAGFSGLACEEDRQQGMDAGAQAYLIKPNDLDKLVETITRLIGTNERLTDSTDTSSRTHC